MSSSSEIRGDQMVSRFCPLCGTDVEGRADLFSSRRQCPNCQQNVRFFDYPNERPAGLPQIAKANAKSFQLLLAVACVAGIAGLAAVYLALRGNWLTPSFLSVIVLLAGISLIAFAVDRHHRLEEAERELQYADELKRHLLDAVQGWRGMQKNFDKLVAEQTAQVQAQLDAGRRELAQRERQLEAKARQVETQSHPKRSS
jgi:hypothetical protein